MKDMRAHFLAFGTGPRMCLGMNIAWSAMRGIVVGVYGRSKTIIAKDQVAPTANRQRDGERESLGVVQRWIAERGSKIWLQFTDVQDT
jgi:hypothetical protein